MKRRSFTHSIALGLAGAVSLAAFGYDGARADDALPSNAGKERCYRVSLARQND